MSDLFFLRDVFGKSVFLHLIAIEKSSIVERKSVLFLLLEDLHSHVVDCGIIKHYYASVRSGFDVYTTVFTKLVVASAKVVADGLDGYIEFVCDLMCGSIWEAVLEAAEFVESNSLSHVSLGFMG